ncbi:MAG: hypothetical protein QM305_14080 [Bacteroidota bacterium]|nr:hypothetical protein [Bacteroidota bacterium]
MALLFFTCCGESGKEQEQEDQQNVEKPKELFKLKNKGWDIYSGPNYRYGPSIIVNDDGSIDAWFAAVGDFHGSWHELYNKTGKNEAVSVPGCGTVGQRFTADVPFWGLMVTSPNWNGQPCGLTLKLFRWNDSEMGYAEVVKQEPVAVKVFVDYKDGERLGVTSEEKFPPGTYLWELSEGRTEHSGYGYVMVTCPVSPVTVEGFPSREAGTGKRCGLKKRPAVISFGIKLLTSAPWITGAPGARR